VIRERPELIPDPQIDLWVVRDLQEAGLVAPGVEAALTPIYAGDVKAQAFRIPAEMVTILAEGGIEAHGDGQTES